MSERDVLTVSEVARLLGVHRAFVYRLAARGEIGHYRFGDVLRFRKEDIEDYLRRAYRPPVKANLGA